VYGKGFVSRLDNTPKKMRIAHEGNSQTRLMVAATDFRTALKRK
jgi:hypothetical protein